MCDNIERDKEIDSGWDDSDVCALRTPAAAIPVGAVTATAYLDPFLLIDINAAITARVRKDLPVPASPVKKHDTLSVTYVKRANGCLKSRVLYILG